MTHNRLKTVRTRVQSLRTQHKRLLSDVSLLNAREREYGRQPRVRVGDELEMAALKRVQSQKKSLLGLVNRQLDALETEQQQLTRS
jgi:hypothetical protein